MEPRKWALILLVSVFLLGVRPGTWAEVIYQEDQEWSLDLPETWQLDQVDEAAGYTSFISQDKSATAQIILRTGFTVPAQAHQDLRTRLKARDGGFSTQSFQWNGRTALLSDLLWSSSGSEPIFHSYLLTVDHRGGILNLLAGSTMANWELQNLWLLSIIDSLALSQEHWTMPGPLSTLLDGDDLVAHIQANQDVIEREASILEQFARAPATMQKKAWTRFYRVVYRDSFSRLADSARDVLQTLQKARVPLPEFPSRLAALLQAHIYERPGTLSDLRSPLDAWVNQTGDCDARALACMIILRQWGIPSILMVSAVHQHALVGIDTAGTGARFDYNGRKWLVGELTVKVPLGQIEQSMSSSADWIGMDLEYNPWSEE